jgi:hypothetical protein
MFRIGHGHRIGGSLRVYCRLEIAKCLELRIDGFVGRVPGGEIALRGVEISLLKIELVADLTELSELRVRMAPEGRADQKNKESKRHHADDKDLSGVGMNAREPHLFSLCELFVDEGEEVCGGEELEVVVQGDPDVDACQSWGRESGGVEHPGSKSAQSQLSSTILRSRGQGIAGRLQFRNSGFVGIEKALFLFLSE